MSQREVCYAQLMVVVKLQVQAGYATETHTEDSTRVIICHFLCNCNHIRRWCGATEVAIFLMGVWLSVIEALRRTFSEQDSCTLSGREKLITQGHFSSCGVPAVFCKSGCYLFFSSFFPARQRLTEVSACVRHLSHLWDEHWWFATMCMMGL